MAQLIKKSEEHPGSILKDRLFDPFRLTARAVSRAADIDEVLLNQILEGSQEIDPDTGLKLASYFSLPDDYFFRIKQVKEPS